VIAPRLLVRYLCGKTARAPNQQKR
jgi:hypothetical protein